MHRLGSILDAFDDVVFTLDREQRHVELFGTWFEREGLSKEVFIGRTATEILGPERGAVHENANRRALAGESLRYEWSIETPSGPRWFQTALSPLRDSHGQIEGIVGIGRDITTLRQTEARLRANRDVLGHLAEVQSNFIAAADPTQVFERLLTTLLDATASEYGFIGEVHTDDAGNPFLKTRALTNIAWDDATRRFYDENAPEGLEFTNLRTLFGEVIRTGEAVLSNDPAGDPRSAGIPPGHPPLSSFLGLPFFSGSEMVGMVGIANRPGGYDQEISEALEPILATCATLISARRTELARTEALRAVERSEARYRAIFEGAAVSLWEEDISRVRAILEDLKGAGVTSLLAHLDEHPELVEEVVAALVITDVNDETLKLFGAGSKEELVADLHRIFTPASLNSIRATMLALFEGRESIVVETEFRTLAGSSISALVKINLPLPDEDRDNVIVSIVDITRLKRAEAQREETISELQRALVRVKRLSGLLPICSRCKKIRDDEGYWKDVAVYLREHSEADFTHGICPDCYDALYHDL